MTGVIQFAELQFGEYTIPSQGAHSMSCTLHYQDVHTLLSVAFIDATMVG